MHIFIYSVWFSFCIQSKCEGDESALYFEKHTSILYSCCSIYDVFFAQYEHFLSNYLVNFARMSGKQQKLNSVCHSILNISAIVRNIRSKMLINRIQPI